MLYLIIFFAFSASPREIGLVPNCEHTPSGWLWITIRSTKRRVTRTSHLHA